MDEARMVLGKVPGNSPAPAAGNGMLLFKLLR